MSEAPPTDATPLSPKARPYIGGQAVLEGVMMRAPTSFAIVVRRADGSLTVRERAVVDPRKGIDKLPFFRGIASLFESLKLGRESLNFSIAQLEKDAEAQDRLARYKQAGTSVLSALAQTLFLLTQEEGAKAAPENGEKKGGPGFFLFAVMAVFLIGLPQLAANGVNGVAHLGLDMQSAKFQALTGFFKLAIVISYMLLMRRMPDIRRMFQYHGAEHKTIATYEAGEELTVANARKYTTLHPRCGTTFLVMVALVSVLVFTGLGAALPKINTGNKILDNLAFFAIKVPFLPVIAAITFEIQRIFARFFTKGPLRVVLWPGFLVQKITTIEPDDDQLEVALASLRVTLFREENATRDGDDVTFADYEALRTAQRLR